MTERIEEIRGEAAEAIGSAASTAELEELRVRYLGRKAELTQILRGIAELPEEDRGPVGKAGNEARRELEDLLASRGRELDASELGARLAEDAIDVTLPGSPPGPVGAQNPLIRTQREIEDVFVGLGYRVMEGPEDVVLQAHTSPMQVRSREARPPPIFIVVPGRCYRSDPFDATHSPIFHQVEGLAAGADITLADLKGTLDELARGIFGPERVTRFRPGFFPFTEPSVEVDVSCFRCGGSGVLPDGSRDPLCKGVGWIEILGAGMVDPNVFGFVREHGYDPEEVQGFAFGLGIERIAMLKHGVPDLRMFFDNDVRVLEQFA